jgi:hypothetical protein
VALCREGALARTGQAHGRGASGCGFRCRKRPGRESPTVPPRRWSALWLELRGEHSSSFRECAPCRTSQIRSGFFSHPSRGVATFSSPSPNRLTDNITAAAALFAILSTTGWYKEARR